LSNLTEAILRVVLCSSLLFHVIKLISIAYIFDIISAGSISHSGIQNL
jgi:hypothetical protein